MANNRLAFGLCKEYGIELPKDATPKDAWEQSAKQNRNLRKVSIFGANR
jgi:hypothetical protein